MTEVGHWSIIASDRCEVPMSGWTTNENGVSSIVRENFGKWDWGEIPVSVAVECAKIIMDEIQKNTSVWFTLGEGGDGIELAMFEGNVILRVNLKDFASGLVDSRSSVGGIGEPERPELEAVLRQLEEAAAVIRQALTA